MSRKSFSICRVERWLLVARLPVAELVLESTTRTSETLPLCTEHNLAAIQKLENLPPSRKKWQFFPTLAKPAQLG